MGTFTTSCRENYAIYSANMSLETDPANQERLAASFLLVRIVLGFIILTVIIISALPHIGIIKLNPQGLSANTSFTNIFLLMGVFLAVSGFTAKKLLLNVAKKENQQKDLNACLQAIHRAHLVAFAIFEAIAILGFVNFMMSADPEAGFIFSAISLGCMILAWPRMRQVQEMIAARI